MTEIYCKQNKEDLGSRILINVHQVTSYSVQDNVENTHSSREVSHWFPRAQSRRERKVDEEDGVQILSLSIQLLT